MSIYQYPNTCITIRNATTGETRSFVESSVWGVDDGNEIPELLNSYFLPYYDCYHPLRPIYRCKEVSVDSVEELAGEYGGYAVRVNVRWETKLNDDDCDREGNQITEDTPPWLMPVEDFTLGTQTVEESMVKVWVPGKVAGEYKAVPFDNSAGTPLTASVSRYRLTMSFSYNMPPDYPDEFAFQFNGKVNADEVMVCGYTFYPTQLQIVSLGINYLRKRVEDGFEIAYKKISVQLLGDPNTFFSEYANIGTVVARVKEKEDGTKKPYRTQLWTAVCAKDFSVTEGSETSEETEYKEGEVVYGQRSTLIKMVREGKLDGATLEAVTEPMFLNEEGSDISKIDPETRRQKPVYLKGCPFEIVPFAPLGLPRLK